MQLSKKQTGYLYIGLGLISMAGAFFSFKTRSEVAQESLDDCKNKGISENQCDTKGGWFFALGCILALVGALTLVSGLMNAFP